MTTMKIIQYIFTFLGCSALGFFYYNMFKKHDEQDEDQKS